MTHRTHNRRYFNELDETLDSPSLTAFGDTLSLLMIDVDDFKKYTINGHPAGDKRRKDAAQESWRRGRDVDSVCRYGGRSLPSCFPRRTKDDAALVAELLRAQVNLYLGSTISIGIASSC